MKYLCLIYEDEKLWQSMPKGDAEKVYGEYFTFTDGIKRSGHYIGGNPLQPTNTATTVRVRNGKVSTTDGPFAETKEVVAGVYVLEARDLDHALELAAMTPVIDGGVEVRLIAGSFGIPGPS